LAKLAAPKLAGNWPVGNPGGNWPSNPAETPFNNVVSNNSVMWHVKSHNLSLNNVPACAAATAAAAAAALD
jgi:hypothetical protein